MSVPGGAKRPSSISTSLDQSSPMDSKEHSSMVDSSGSSAASTPPCKKGGSGDAIFAALAALNRAVFNSSETSPKEAEGVSSATGGSLEGSAMFPEDMFSPPRTPTISFPEAMFSPDGTDASNGLGSLANSTSIPEAPAPPATPTPKSSKDSDHPNGHNMNGSEGKGSEAILQAPLPAEVGRSLDATVAAANKSFRGSKGSLARLRNFGSSTLLPLPGLSLVMIAVALVVGLFAGRFLKV
ncbi:hypothetical protein T484DRAFT_1929865 [Baffinella frigidus]|nr:hypothetical protein T484DRAFT_1929865 [Cryptophyta sp. CCMP2293]